MVAKISKQMLQLALEEKKQIFKESRIFERNKEISVQLCVEHICK